MRSTRTQVRHRWRSASKSPRPRWATGSRTSVSGKGTYLRDPAGVGELFLVRPRSEVGAEAPSFSELPHLRLRLASGLRLGGKDLAVANLVRRLGGVRRED